MIDGAHIRAVPGHQNRHVDVTVGKVEVVGRKPRRFAFAPKDADRPVEILRDALGAQGLSIGPQKGPGVGVQTEPWLGQFVPVVHRRDARAAECPSRG